jgi:hypothetical protein
MGSDVREAGVKAFMSFERRKIHSKYPVLERYLVLEQNRSTGPNSGPNPHPFGRNLPS